MTAKFESESIALDQLIAGNSGLLVSRQITLASGQNLQRGAVLGRVAADGKYVLSLTAAGDGSEVPDLILAEDTDASAQDAATMAYARGDFAERHLIVGTGHTVDSIREGLRVKGVTLVKTSA